MKVAKAISNLTEAFERLPGIGPKSAQRLTYYLLHVPQTELDRLAAAVSDLKKNTRVCRTCFNVSENDPCEICADPGRDKGIVCVVEQPLNIVALERGNNYSGVYHILHGVIDPLHNIGPEELFINDLINRIEQSINGQYPINEIILALNPNMEGEATALYIKRIINQQLPMSNIKITRLAAGLPIGADIEYADEMTLNKAMEGRVNY